MSRRLSAEYKKQARKLIIENADRFIKRYFNDDRNLITRQNDYKRYGVIERDDDGKLKLLITISRTSFPANTSVCGKYIEDFVALILANVEGIDIVCNVDLKWKYGIIGGEIISQFNEKFGIYRQEVHSGRKCITSNMKKFYEMYDYANNPDIEFVDFDFHLNSSNI